MPVVAVDDLVCAEIPLAPGWQDVDPADYGAPDPAGFLSADDGFAAILGAATGLEKGETIRGGADNDEILTTYTGSVPGDVVDRVIPGASGDFELTAQVTDDDELREMCADRRLLRRRRSQHLHRRLRRLRHDEGRPGAV